MPSLNADGRDLADDRFARLLDRTSQPFLITDLEGRIVRANGAFERMLGYEPGSLDRRTIDEISPVRWHAVSRGAFEQLIVTGTAQRYFKEYFHHDGHVVPVACVTDIDRDSDDQIRGFYAFVTDMTEAKRAEDALRASEERFRELYDEAPFGYHVIDATGTLLSVNRTECEMLGYARDEMVGGSIFDFIEPTDRIAARQALEKQMRAGTGDIEPTEYTFRAKDGRALTLHIEGRLLRDREGHPVGIRSTVQDVTATRRTQEALIASERRLRALFEGIDDAVFVHNADGKILDANPAASRKLGYTHEEFLRLNTRDIDDSDFACGFEDRLEEQLERGHLSCEGRHRRKDGRLIPVDINTSTIQLNGQTAVLAVIRDITERKALEETRRLFAEAQARYASEMEERAQAVSRSEARYRQLSESLLDALLATDLECRITLFNRAAEEVFGYRREEVLLKPLDMLIPCDPTAPVADVCEALRRRDLRVVGRTLEVSGRRADGETLPLEISVSLIEAEAGREFVISMRDLTERHRMRAMLMQSEKLASIGLLSAGVAHEINNPLSYIANNLAVLERDVRGMLEMIGAYESAGEALRASAPEVAQRIERIAADLDWPYVRSNLDRMLQRTREGVKRVATIVGHMRGMARTEAPNLEPASLADLIDSALEMVEPRLKKSGITLSVDRVPLSKIACVPTQVSQVMINLLVNAVQAMEGFARPGGHKLWIRLGSGSGEQFFAIADTGPGIAPQNLDRIFDPFYSSKPVGEGTGLGLSISHSIVSGHGGRIEVSSTPGAGSTFTVYLPERSPT